MDANFTHHDPDVKPVVIGITGGIGSGKSRVSRFWSTYFHLPLIDVDRICRRLLQKGEPGWKALRSRLGSSFFADNEELERKRLRFAISHNSDVRRQVNELIHPLALQVLQREVGMLAAPLVLADVPLLYEAGWQNEFQNIVVVFAGLETCCRRVVQRDGVNGENALKMIRAQMALFEKALMADHVIDNRGNWLYTRLQTLHLAGLFFIGFKENT